MEYYLSAPETIYKPVKKMILEKDNLNFLLSFATSSKHFETFYKEGKNKIMIDSGAYSAWNSGKVIDLEAYLAYCKKLPEEVLKINLDVIPETGSSMSEINKCVEKGFENYLYLKKHLKNVLPVYHYGEDISWARRMLEETDYICVSPANDTGEPIKREFFKYCFSELPTGVKTHTLGYSSIDGLAMFPFFSADSISYKKTHMHGCVSYVRSDKSIIDLDIGEYAKIKSMVYDSNKGLSEQPELLTSGTYDTIMAIIEYFEILKEKNKTKDFTYLKQQLNLF
jgi:hypothetical protein